MRLLVGGYTAESDGRASGIGMLHAGAPDDILAGGQLSRRADAVTVSGSPSWVARHPTLDVVYAALEGAGQVQAFRRTGPESYAAIGMRREAGSLACHVAVAPDGGSLIASCWGDGRVVRMPLAADGSPGTPVIAAAAEDPYAVVTAAGSAPGGGGAANGQPAGPMVSAPRGGGLADGVDLAAAARALREAAGAEYAHLVPDYPEKRGLADEPGVPDGVGAADEAPAAERVSRAHQARFLPGGLIATTDMGLDLVRFWRATGGGLIERGRVVLPRGSGPRHTVWHQSGHLYVVTELSHEVFVLAPDAAGTWRLVGGAPISPAVLAGDTSAELAPSRDGDFLYAGMRGSDTIGVLRVRGSGADLRPVALVEAGVAGPRHHVVLRDTLLVAGQHSDEVASLAIDPRTGVPGRVRHRVESPSPSCLLPLP